MQVNCKRYGLFLLPVAGKYSPTCWFGILLVSMGQLVSAIVANLIGGLIFFRIDQFVFISQSLATQWEIRDNIAWVDCGKVARGYRPVRSGITSGPVITSPSSGARHVR